MHIIEVIGFENARVTRLLVGCDGIALATMDAANDAGYNTWVTSTNVEPERDAQEIERAARLTAVLAPRIFGEQA